MPTLFDHFVIQKPDQLTDQLQVDGSIYQKLETDYNGFKNHSLIAAHHFSETWNVWEKHPAGDEVVVLLTGSAKFLLKLANGNQSILLNEAGAYAIVPKGVWHTAEIHEPTTLLFITPGEGTLNEATPQD